MDLAGQRRRPSSFRRDPGSDRSRLRLRSADSCPGPRRRPMPFARSSAVDITFAYTRMPLTDESGGCSGTKLWTIVPSARYASIRKSSAPGSWLWTSRSPASGKASAAQGTRIDTAAQNIARRANHRSMNTASLPIAAHIPAQRSEPVNDRSPPRSGASLLAAAKWGRASLPRVTCEGTHSAKLLTAGDCSTLHLEERVRFPPPPPSRRIRTAVRAVLARGRCEQRQGVERGPGPRARPPDCSPSARQATERISGARS